MKVERLVGIIMLLLDKTRLGARELADLFEVSPRTIYRDMESINLAGIPVRATPGVGGGFEIMPSYKVDKKVFSAADLSAILMGLSGLSGMMRGDELVNALAKVRSFIPADRAKDIELRANQVLVDVSPWMGNRNIQANLELIKTALQECRVLSFDYADRYGTKSARTAEPHQLVLKAGHWYWYGYCRTRGDFRLFKLSRTSKLQMQGEVFSPREHQKPNLDGTDAGAALRRDITLRIHASLMDRLLDQCPLERFAPDGEEHYLVVLPFIENDYHYDMLLGFGARCECLEPPPIRAELKRRIGVMAALYEG